MNPASLAPETADPAVPCVATNNAQEMRLAQLAQVTVEHAVGIPSVTLTAARTAQHVRATAATAAATRSVTPMRHVFPALSTVETAVEMERVTRTMRHAAHALKIAENAPHFAAMQPVTKRKTVRLAQRIAQSANHFVVTFSATVRKPMKTARQTARRRFSVGITYVTELKTAVRALRTAQDARQNVEMELAAQVQRIAKVVNKTAACAPRFVATMTVNLTKIAQPAAKIAVHAFPAVMARVTETRPMRPVQRIALSVAIPFATVMKPT